jgi:hypothetical protein
VGWPAGRWRATAATQANVVGHSMGGILGRIHVGLGNAGYYRKDNFMKGDIKKLITLDTPHTGSPWPSLLVDMRDYPPIGPFLKIAMGLFAGPIDRGAFDDLANYSFALGLIDRTRIPGHALFGIGGYANPLFAPQPGEKVASLLPDGGTQLMMFFDDLTDPFEGLQHDGAVEVYSQKGGLTAATSLFDGWAGQHTHNTTSGLYSERVTELLHTSTTDPQGPFFDEFPPPRDLFPPAYPKLTRRGGASLPATALFGPDPVITTPAPNTVVTSGVPQLVVVDAPTATRVLLVGPETIEVDDTAPFEFQFMIPARAAGNFPIRAFAAYATGSFGQSNAVNLVVRTRPVVTLQSLTIEPLQTTLAIGSTRQLAVLGRYSDGVTRDITDASTGTTFHFDSGGNVVSVSSAGLVTALSRGTASIRARNGSHDASVSIFVLP